MDKRVRMTNNVGKLREIEEITQEEFSRRIMVTRQTLVAIERGTYCPTLQLAFVIAHHLDARLHDVFDYQHEQ